MPFRHITKEGYLVMSIYEFGNLESGLHFTIEETVDASGTHFTVHMITGSMNLNALYWSDGDAVAKGSTFTGFTGAKSENSLNMNGDNVVWNDDGTSTTSKEVYDGGIKLSDAGLGHGSDTFLTAGGADYHFDVAGLDLSDFGTLAVRATSTSTAGGSIKWADSTPEAPCEPHAGDLIWAENFDVLMDPNASQVYDNGQLVFESLNLGLNGWTGTGGHSELGHAGYSGTTTTSGDWWLDTQNSPGPIDISHVFVDATGDKAQLSFDVMKEAVTFAGSNYATDPNAELLMKVDGNVVADIHASDFANSNTWQHFDFVINTGAAGSQHTVELVDATANSGYAGFAVDSIQVHDWITC
jgi:hypothetical protein